MKNCKKCDIEKPIAEFYRDSSHPSGYQRRCKECSKALINNWRSKNKQNLSEYDQAWQCQNRDKKLEINRKSSLKLKFGMSLADYDKLLSEQGSCCAICGVSSCESGRNFAVDHNHDTGEIRGILCLKCNTAIGRFQDSPLILKNAYQYLIEKGHYGRQDPKGP